MKNLAVLILAVAGLVSFANRSSPPAPALEPATPSTAAIAPTAAEKSRPAPVQRRPAARVSNCHPNYSGCLDANAVDYDCVGGAGNGPLFTGEVRVLGRDVFQLDSDGDGLGCDGR